MNNNIVDTPAQAGEVLEKTTRELKLELLPAQWQKALIPIKNKIPWDLENSKPLDDWLNLPPFPQDLLRKAPATGLKLGPTSRTLAIDFDAIAEDPAGVDRLFAETFGRPPSDLPKTIGCTSGLPGRRELFFLVEEQWWELLSQRKSYVKAPDKSKLEFRWEGLQSVIIGHHPKTDGYKWLPGCSPEEQELTEAPEWLLEGIPRKQTPRAHEPTKPENPTGHAFDGLAVPLQEFISQEHRILIERGSKPGSNNDQGLAIALDLVGTEAWLKNRGAKTEPTAEKLFEQYLDNSEQLWEEERKETISQGLTDPGCFDYHKGLARFEGAYALDPAPSTPDALLLKRIEYHRTKARRAGRISTDQRCASPRRITAGELVEALLGELGQPRLNTRTQEVVVGDRILSKDDVATLYLELSSAETLWAKDPTFDAVMYLAKQHAFDPAQIWLLEQTEGKEPISEGEWKQLDQLLLGIEDPVAAAYLPRFLVAAVARLFKPGCEVHQMPVLIGKQGIGKTRLGRALFGEENYCSIRFSARLDRDDITKADRHWCNEFGEIDGLTSKADVEAIKDFLSTSHDVIRRAYGRGEETLPRRWVGWATSNGSPLRDLTGNRRFVCIPLGPNPLPVDEIKAKRGSIWAKALQIFLEGEQWWSTPEEANAIEARNLDHLEVDPWEAAILEWLGQQNRVQIHNLLTGALDLPKAQQNNAASARARKLLEKHGWTYARRKEGRKWVRAMWRPNKEE